MKKNIIVLIATDKEDRLVKGGCPVRNHDFDYNAYFQALTDDCPIVVTAGTYSALPEKSPPYPCRDTYIIDPDGKIDLPEGLTRTSVVTSLQEAFQKCKNADKIIIIGDTLSFHKEIMEYEKDIELIVKVIFNETSVTDEMFDASAFLNWFPLLKVGTLLDEHSKSSAFSIFELRYRPFIL